MTNRSKRIIGAVHSGYPEERNIIGLPFEHYTVQMRKKDPLKMLDYLYFKTRNRTNLLFHNLSLGRGAVDVFHYFNGLSFGKVPWVTTFETSLPRLREENSYWNRKGVKLMAGSSCKKLLALSGCAKEIQLEVLKAHYPQFYDTIAPKIEVLHPAQPLMIEDYAEKKLDGPITFTMVGADFFRKGGKEVLEVFQDLILDSQDVHLNIVSRMKYGDYASQTTATDLQEAMAIIHKFPDHIFHKESLPNEEVLALFKRTHIALLPTYADTYGYTVLEAQASGCPVISTNIRALPEINDNEVGYLLDVPKYGNGNAKIAMEGDLGMFSKVLKEQLETTIRRTLACEDEIAKKARLCLERIREKHNPVTVAKRLEEVYDAALG